MIHLLNKPKNITSFKFIKTFANELGVKKIGHTGTLDPMATGLMLVCTGDDTKFIPYIENGEKEYLAQMVLHKNSDTYDTDGQVIQMPVVKLSDEEIFSTINSFVKKYDQLPPIFSAKKINGKRAYDLARQGKEVKLKTSKVDIIKIWDIEKNNDHTFSFKVRVSKGTYIRSLIYDIGQALNTYALMSELRRIQIHNLSVEDIGSVNVEELINIPPMDINKNLLIELLNGKKDLIIEAKDGKYLIRFNNSIVGIMSVEKNKINVIKILGNKVNECM